MSAGGDGVGVSEENTCTYCSGIWQPVVNTAPKRLAHFADPSEPCSAGCVILGTIGVGRAIREKESKCMHFLPILSPTLRSRCAVLLHPIRLLCSHRSPSRDALESCPSRLSATRLCPWICKAEGPRSMRHTDHTTAMPPSAAMPTPSSHRFLQESQLTKMTETFKG